MTNNNNNNMYSQPNTPINNNNNGPTPNPQPNYDMNLMNKITNNINNSTKVTPNKTETTKSSLVAKDLVKCQLGKEIRLKMIQNDDLTYNDLWLLVKRLFDDVCDTLKESPEKIDYFFKYKDDDGDLITMKNDQDLELAKNFCMF